MAGNWLGYRPNSSRRAAGDSPVWMMVSFMGRTKLSCHAAAKAICTGAQRFAAPSGRRFPMFLPCEAFRLRRRVRQEVQRHAIDAVALARGLRTVVENVPQMPAASAAMHLSARHEERVVLR